MQPIAVAISDENVGRRAKLENLLHGEPGIKILTNVKSNENDMSKDRRLIPRANITVVEDRVARVRRLNPRILFADISQCIDADYAMLESLRRECPQTLVVLLADESDQQEDQLIRALASGARGYLDVKAEKFNLDLSKAAHVVDRGEAWVPRKMLGRIMNEVSQWCQISSGGGHLDPAR
ncbi:MAG: DNA-binding response regulator [Gallionellaceae bacterium]